LLRWLILVAVAVGTLAGAAEGTTTAGCTNALIISAKSGKVLRRLPQPVYSVVADGRGGWYVADSRLWHLRRDGSVDEGWHSPVRRVLGYGAADSAPGMLARYRDRLYLAGRRRVVAVEAATGRVLWRSPSVAGPILFGRRPTITGLAAGSGRVYVGGTFAHFGPAKRGGLAALAASTGHLLSWQAPPLLQQAPSRIYSPGSATRLALSASRIYVVGAFNQVGVGRRRVARPGVEAVRRSDGRLTGFLPRARIEEPVSVAAWGRLLLLGCGARVSVCEAHTGVFDARTGAPVRRFAFDEVLGAAAVGFAGPTAYLGAGSESDFGHNNYLIAIDLRTGRFDPWFPKSGYYVDVTEISVSGDRVLVAGSFCPGP
jgi:hypothetical protein